MMIPIRRKEFILWDQLNNKCFVASQNITVVTCLNSSEVLLKFILEVIRQHADIVPIMLSLSDVTLHT